MGLGDSEFFPICNGTFVILYNSSLHFRHLILCLRKSSVLQFILLIILIMQYMSL